jgi:hypothetical protein
MHDVALERCFLGLFKPCFEIGHGTCHLTQYDLGTLDVEHKWYA